MNRLKSIILAIILLGVMSLGFRFSSIGTNSLTNIYLYDSKLLVSDETEGVHIYSVADAANPRRTDNNFVISRAFPALIQS